MKLYLQLLILHKLLLGIFIILIQYTTAQAQTPVLVSTDDDDIICQGDSITFRVTPLPPSTPFPKYTYKFFRGDTEIASSDKNSFTFTDTKNITTATEIEIKAKISSVASSGAASVLSNYSNAIKFKIRPIKTPVIKQKTLLGWSNLPDDIFSTAPEIILDAREVIDPNDAQGIALPANSTGFFTGEAVKRTGPNEYKFFPSFATPGINTIFYTYTQDDNPSSPPDGCTKTVQATITVKANSGAIKGLTPSVDVNCVKNKENAVGLNFNNASFPFACYEFNSCYSYTVTFNLISITGNGISGDLATGFKFNPLKARTAGDISSTDVSITYSITYRKKNFFGTEFDVSTTAPITVTEKVDLYTIEELQITNSGQEFSPSASFCRTETVILTGVPSSIAGQFRIKKPSRPDGTVPPVETRGTPYEIPWKNDATNYPAGEYEITYKYTNPNGCESIDKVIKLTLKEVPAASSIDPLIYNYCVGETIPPLVSVASAGFTTLWRKGDPNATASTGNSFDPEVNNMFANSVNIYVTQFNGTCESTIKTITINVSPQPIANFVYKNSCVGGFTEFEDRTDSKGNTILKTIWDFGDGDILQEGTGNIPPGMHGGRTSGTYANPKHNYLTADIYQVTLTLVTSACPDSEIRPIYIFPLQSTFPYLETFENGSAGWLAKKDTLSSWELKQPSGIRISPDSISPTAWITSKNENSYNSPENSFVESPCFQLSNTFKPYLSVNIKSDIEEGLDGAVIQYAVDNTNTFDDQLQWKVLGIRNQGINWYNTSGIVSNPGGQSTSVPAVGWSGYLFNEEDETKWVTAKFDLGQVKQEAAGSLVRFRIVFSSNSDNPPNRSFDGFAFDNFVIGEINRTVLLEHFTNTSQPSFIEETKKIYQTIQGKDIASIQYHTSFPAEDSINNKNKADPSARALLYGIVESNRAVLDGIMYENKAFSEGDWGKNAFSQRVLFESPFNIDIQLADGEDKPLKINAVISKNNTLNDIISPLVVQTAIVQKTVESGSASYQNVLKKLLPDAAGKRITGLWKASDDPRIDTVTHTWQPSDTDAAPDTYAVIIYIQDENTKEIYQAKEKSITVSLKANPSGDRGSMYIDKEVVFENNIQIAPNPATDNIYITFSDPTNSDFTLSLYDALGRSIISTKISKGSSEYVLSTHHFPEGIYFVQLTQKASSQVFRKKLFIVH